MNTFQIIASFAGFLVIISAMPQVFEIIKHKSAKDVSLPMFIILCLANILWFIYAVHIKDVALSVTNLLAGLIAFTNIILILRYRNAKNTH